MAKNAGVDFEDWIAEAVAEYAEDLGVDPDELNERERLEAIEERIDRLARAGSTTPRPQASREAPQAADRRAMSAPRYGEPAESRPLPRAELRLPPSDEDDERIPARNNERQTERSAKPRDRLGEALDALEKRTERSPKRTARPAETPADLRPNRDGDEGRLAAAIEQIEQRAKRNEERTARALESMSGIFDSRGDRQRLDETIKQIETRAERNEDRAARALDSLTKLAEKRGAERERLEAAIAQVESRAARNEERTARALESLAGLVDERGGERERLEAAIAEVEQRAERNAERTARAFESLKGMMEARQGERERMEAAIARIGARTSESEARTARALQSLSGLMRDEPVADRAEPPAGEPRVAVARPSAPAAAPAESARIDEPPLASPERPRAPSGARNAGGDDTEALRLVSERLARRRRIRSEAAAPDGVAGAIQELGASVERVRQNSRDMAAFAPLEAKLDEVANAAREHDLNGAVDRLQRDLRALSERVEALSGPAVGNGALESLQKQTEDIQTALDAAARNAPPVERLERQIAELAHRVERLVGAGATPADVAAALKTLAETQNQIERAAPVAALAAIERRIDELGGRIEEAARRPAFDPRPLEELGRRVETIRATLERQGARRPDSAALASALQTINEKLDRASAAGAQSVSSMATLREMTSRLEEAIQRPAAVSLDARPIEDLARRIDGVRGVVERQASAAPKLERLEASVQQLAEKLERPAAPAKEIAGIEAALTQLAAKIDTTMERGAGEIEAIEGLEHRVEVVRKAVERNSTLTEQVQRLEDALGEIRARLDRPALNPQIDAVDATMRRLAEKFEAAMGRPVAIDAKPIEDLANRIEGIKGALERQERFGPQAMRLEAALGEIREKLERAPKPDLREIDAALRQLTSQIEAAAARPTTVAIDPKPIEDLARRIDGMRSALERQERSGPQAARLEAALGEIREKLEHAAKPDLRELDAALRQLAVQVEASASRPATVAIDPRPIEDLARRIDSVKGAVERQERFGPQAARLEAALEEIRQKLDHPAKSDADLDAAFKQLASRVDEAVNRPTTFAIDPKPIEDLARRIESVKGAVERQERFGPQAARLEAALDEIREKLDHPARSDADLDAAFKQLASRVDEAVNRPTTVAIDPKPIEDLARRIESVRASLEKPQSLAPQVERLETALGAVAEKLDRAGPLIDHSGLNSTLAAMNARLEEAFRQPVPFAIDRDPIDALARRVEAVRETVERQAEQIDVVGRPIGDLAERLEAVRESVERQAERLDLGRLEETFRDAVAKLSQPGVGGDELSALVEAIERLATKVDGGATAFDIARMESLLQDVAARVENPRVENVMTAVVAAIKDLSAKVERGASASEVARIESILDQVLERFEDQGTTSGDMTAVVGALSELAERVSRIEAPIDIAPLEDLLQDMASRLDRLDAKVSFNGEANPASDADRAQFERVVRELLAKVGELGAGADNRAVEQDIRLLHDKIDDLADSRLDGPMLERAARSIAEKIEQRVPSADPGAFLGHVQEIHERLDDLVASRAGSASLERAAIDLTDELEVFRALREAASRDSAVLADVRADQLQLDRQLDQRFASLRQVLETLLERLAKLERAPAVEPKADHPASPPNERPGSMGPTSERLALHDIPDRPEGPSRPPALADMSPLSAQIAAQGRTREAPDVAAKTAAISAHIAAARRAANNAAVEAERREPKDTHRAETARSSAGLGSRTRALLGQHRNSVLLGGAAGMALLTGVAVMELRAHAPERKSEIDAPAAAPTAFSQAPSSKDAVSSAYDPMPTGALATAAPKVVTEPLPSPVGSPSVRPPLSPVKPASELIAAMPAGLPTALAAAGSNGDVGAEVEIAQRYLEGRTVPRDPKIAAGWFQAAADAGSPFAQYRLGGLYEKGVGVTRDLAKARELYTKAANVGNVRAMHNLAVLYAQDGGSGKPDYASAMDWFRRAGAYGVRDSQFNLGVLYGRGLGAGQDLANAWLWFSLAAKQGDADAAHKRDEVANRMDGKIMGVATKLLSDFKVKTPDSAVNDPPAPPPDAAADAPSSGRPGDPKGVKL